MKNIIPVKHVVNVIREDSVKASTRFADNSLDFVFIDAEHTYEGVLADIQAWLPKVKVGGILAGHDYLPQLFPGVCQAVDQMFPQKIMRWGTSVWEYKKCLE